MNELEKAWLAGFFDGEGCLHVTERKPCGRMAPQVHIANCNKPVMEHVARLLGAEDKLRKVNTRAGWRCRWHVAVCGAERILRLLDDIQPYLVCKQEEATVFRAILETYSRPGVHPIPAEVIARRLELKERLRSVRTREYVS